MGILTMSHVFGSDAVKSGVSARLPDDVVEIGVFLPAHRAEALMALSRQRHQSVGQILRGLIDQVIAPPAPDPIA
jgi:hypothetical protein